MSLIPSDGVGSLHLEVVSPSGDDLDRLQPLQLGLPLLVVLDFFYLFIKLLFY